MEVTRRTKIYVPMTDEEFVKLVQVANKECRHPRDQARHILRLALLGGSDKPTNANTGAESAKTTPVFAA